MDEWRKLTEEEKETMLSYFNARNKPALIFFTAIKCLGVLQLALGIIYLIQNIRVFPIINALFFLLGLIACFGMFYLIPNLMIYCTFREVNAIKKNIAQVIETVVIEKGKAPNGNGRKKADEFYIIAPIKGNYTYLECYPREIYTLLNKDDKCKVMFFPLSENDRLGENFIRPFDYNLDFIKYMNTNK